MTREAIELLDYAARRGAGIIHVIVKADGPALSIRPNAAPALLSAVAANPDIYHRALLELVDRGYISVEHDSRPGGRGRAALCRHESRSQRAE